MKIRRLVIVHYHLRASGVRRVIEALIAPLQARGVEVVLLAGEAAEAGWDTQWPSPPRVWIEPAFGYFSEMPAGDPEEIRRAIRSTLASLPEDGTAIWLHNPAVGRNLLVADEIRRFSSTTGVPVLAHQHDFWYDGRWARWREFEQAGLDDLDAVADAVFLTGANAVHAVLNSRDGARLAAGGLAPQLLPNPVPRTPVGDSRSNVAEWMNSVSGGRRPFWIYPTRILRRKNLLEAVLLAQWLNPGGTLFIPGRASSADEEAYERSLAGAVTGKNVVLGGACADRPVHVMISASDAVIQTSLAEGFGLSVLEAASRGLPFLARHIEGVFDDLAAVGCVVKSSYRDVSVPESCLDVSAERLRQQSLRSRWIATLPVAARAFVPADNFQPVFSRLSLAGQLEVLTHGRDSDRMRGANPWLGSIFPPGPATMSPEAAATFSEEAACDRLLCTLGKTVEVLPVAARAAGEVWLRAGMADPFPLLLNS